MCECEMCGGQLLWLGRLGNLIWLRCTQCGWEQSMDADEFEPEDFPED